MDDSSERPLRRPEASAAVTDLGWRYVLGLVRTIVAVGSLAEAASVATRLVAAAGPDADGHLCLDVRRDQLIVSLQSLATGGVTTRDADLAAHLTAAVRDLGLTTEPGADRSVQVLEIAIDALDIPAIRPFWKAVMGYVDEAGRAGPQAALVDPSGQSPAIWFQQMDAPRPQRNRIHFDISVPHDEATHRVKAALDAGGTLRSDAFAPAFWVLADVEGNEACVTTWQGRDD